MYGVKDNKCLAPIKSDLWVVETMNITDTPSQKSAFLYYPDESGLTRANAIVVHASVLHRTVQGTSYWENNISLYAVAKEAGVEVTFPDLSPAEILKVRVAIMKVPK